MHGKDLSPERMKLLPFRKEDSSFSTTEGNANRAGVCQGRRAQENITGLRLIQIKATKECQVLRSLEFKSKFKIERYKPIVLMVDENGECLNSCCWQEDRSCSLNGNCSGTFSLRNPTVTLRDFKFTLPTPDT